MNKTLKADIGANDGDSHKSRRSGQDRHFHLKPGNAVILTGPHGCFIIMKSGLKPVFVATGTAPFVSIARSGVKDFILLHGVSAESERYYREEFGKAAKRYVPCLSENGKKTSDAFSGKVTSYLEKTPGRYV